MHETLIDLIPDVADPRSIHHLGGNMDGITVVGISNHIQLSLRPTSFSQEQSESAVAVCRLVATLVCLFK
jgi:hypothetical protein